MTRARTASYGVVTPPPLDRWIEAVLMLFVSLAQGAATTLGMIFNRNRRGWHTETAAEDLPQATSGIHPHKESHHPHGVILGQAKRDPRISVGPSQGLAGDPLEPNNQDSRHKAGNDSALADASGMEANLLVRVPCGGRGPVLREAQTSTNRATSTLTRADPAPARILNASKDARETADGVARAKSTRA